MIYIGIFIGVLLASSVYIFRETMEHKKELKKSQTEINLAFNKQQHHLGIKIDGVKEFVEYQEDQITNLRKHVNELYCNFSERLLKLESKKK